MKRLLLVLAFIFALAISAQAATIPITGTVRTANGNLFNGRIRFTLTYGVGRDSVSSEIVVAAPVEFRINNGVLPTGSRIVPNDTIQPANTQYVAEYFSAAGTKVAQNVFSIQGASFNIGQATPTPLTTSNISFNIDAYLNLPNVNCALSAGADGGAKLATCMASTLPSTGGVANGTALTSSQTISSDPFAGITKPVTLILSAATYTSSVNITVPANVTLQLEQGAIFSMNSARTLTINGGMTGSFSKRFDGAGTVAFGTSFVNKIPPQWWGALGDGSADDTTAFQKWAAIGGKLWIPNTGSNYKITNTVTVSRSGTLIECDGQGNQTPQSKIAFNPGSALPLFDITAGASIISHVGMRDCYISGAGSNKKTGIRIIDGNDIVIRNVTIDTLQGGTSVGVQINGRQLIKTDTVNITNVDLPIAIGLNPNLAASGCDHCTFEDIYLLATDSTQPCIQVDNNSNISAFTVRHASWVLCKYGFYWADTTSAAVDSVAVFENIRWEQSTSTAGYGIYFSHNYTFGQLSLRDVYLANPSLNSGGIYLHKVLDVIFENVQIPVNSGTAINMDSTVDKVWHVNTRFTGTATITDNATGVGGCWMLGGNRVCKIPNAVFSHYNPGTTSSASQLDSIKITVGNGSAVNMFTNAVIGFLATVPTGALGCLWHLNGAFNTVTTVFTNTGACTTTVDNAATQNVYYSGGFYVYQNKTGASMDLKFILLGTGER